MNDLTGHVRTVAAASVITISEPAIQLICDQAAGGARDALSLLDQCSIMCDNEVNEDNVRMLLGLSDKNLLAKLLTAVLVHDIAAIIALLDTSDISQDTRQLFADMLKYAQVQMHTAVKANDKQLALRLSKLIISGSATIAESRWSLSPRLLIEAALINLALEELAEPRPAPAIKPPQIIKPQLRPQPAEQPVASVTAVAEQRFSAPADIPLAVAESLAADELNTVAKDDYQLLWDNVLVELRRMNKRLVIECAKNGRILAINGGNTVVAFAPSGNFFKERLEKDDYRKQVELALHKLTGRETTLAVIIKDDAEKPKTQPTQVEQFSEFFGVEVKKV